MLANRPDDDRRASLLQADPHLRRDRHPGRTAARLGRPRRRRAGDRSRGRTPGRRPGRRPLPGARRAARRDDARRPRRPRDQGREPRAAGRHPRLGAAVRRRPRATESTYFLSANRNKESIALDLKDDGRPGRPAPPGRPRPTCWWRTSAPACSTGSASASSRCRPRNPRLVVLSITGFGHDGPEGGRAGYDQIAQGEAGLMSLTGSGPDDPQRVGVPIARPAGRDVRRLRRGRRAARAAPHRSRHRRADLAARRGRRRARLPGHPVDGGRRGRPRAGQPPPLDRAVRPVPLPRRLGADRGRQRGPVARFCAAFGLDPDAEGLATNRERVGNRERVIELVEDGLRRIATPSRCWPGWPRSASRPARCAASTRSTRGTRR